MKTKEALKLVAGSLVVYVIVVACGTAANNQDNVLSDAGSGAASSGSPSGSAISDAMASNGATDAVGDAVSSVVKLLDALADPVAKARAGTQSGSRLKAKWYVGADGSKVFTGMYDSQLMSDCFFVQTGDGTTRCFPSGLSTGLLFGSYYSDGGCSQGLAWSPTAACAAPKYVTSTVVIPGCTTQISYHLYPIAAAFTGTIYSGTPAMCTPLSAGQITALASYSFYAVGPEVAPSGWVQATMQTDP